MAIMRFLLVGILRAGASHYWAEGEVFFGGFTNHFVGAIKQEPRVPKRFALIGDDDGVAEFQIHDGVEEVEFESNIVGVGEGFGQR